VPSRDVERAFLTDFGEGKGVEGRADVHALGCVDESVPDLRSVRPDLPPHLIEAVTAGLANAPDDRPSSAGEFARAAEAALSG
jgi:hypothetical protein